VVLQQFQQYWAAKSPDIDVFMVDVIWQGILAPHAVDMKKYFKEDEIAKFFPRIIENNTVGGRLVSIPWHTDAGLLYYRTDLLEKYGYKEPPKTWEELAEMAKKIQDGERAALRTLQARARSRSERRSPGSADGRGLFRPEGGRARPS